MALDKILAISGKPGLYKLVTQMRTSFVSESLLDGKRLVVGMSTKVSILSEISMYTLEGEIPLREVLQKVKEKENGKKTTISHKAEKTALEEYFFTILPNYDEDRVYASDIKKVIQWYNILVDHNLVDFSNPDKPEEEDTAKIPENEE